MNTIAPVPLLSSPPSLSAKFLEPAGLQWSRFAANDGASLRWARLTPQEAWGQCVVVGGYSECIEKYFETVRDLATMGLAVFCVDWRGQGGSDRGSDHDSTSAARGRTFEQDAADLSAFIAKMTSRERPRLLIAHSMGGAIALLALHKDPKLVDAAVLSAPMIEVETGPVPVFVARILARAMMAVRAGSCFVPGAGAWHYNAELTPANSRTSHDPERCTVLREWFETHPRLRMDGATFAWLHAAFALTARLKTPAFLAGISTPILLGSAGQDFFVDARAHRKAAQTLPDCQLVDFPGARHELFMEHDDVRVPWFAAIKAFITTRLRRSS